MPQPLISPTAWALLSPTDSFWADLAQTALPVYANACRWFAGKARPQTGFSASVVHRLPIQTSVAYLLIVAVDYADGGSSERYLLPVAFVPTEPTAAEPLPKIAVISPVEFAGQTGTLVDGIYDEAFRAAIYAGIYHRQTVPQLAGTVVFQRGRGLAEGDETVSSTVLPAKSSNSAMTFGPDGKGKYFLKLYRKLFDQSNPEAEMVAFLSETGDFDRIPAFGGSIVWQQADGPDVTLGMLQQMVANDKDAWMHIGDYLNDFLYAVPNRMFAINEDVFDKVELLGKRTAQMHLALYQPQTTEPMFAPEMFTDDYRAFLTNRFSDLLERRYALLIDNYAQLDPLTQRMAWVFMEAKEMIEDFVSEFQTRSFDSLRIRVHGDFHLEQVLVVPEGDWQTDFVMIDFEGEPESSIAERKIKHSPLKDVAGAIRSYHYAVCSKLFNARETGTINPEHLQRVSDRWFYLIRDTFLNAYLDEFGAPHPLFANNNEINFLLLVYLLEKAVYELGYEISYRPTWVKIPLRGIIDVIREIEKIRLANRGHSDELPRLQTGLLQNKV
jgi:maltose alpha-D-glucosyltransferase / alpha-amylase